LNRRNELRFLWVVADYRRTDQMRKKTGRKGQF
jgi:hypothetical protein